MGYKERLAEYDAVIRAVYINFLKKEGYRKQRDYFVLVENGIVKKVKFHHSDLGQKQIELQIEYSIHLEQEKELRLQHKIDGVGYIYQLLPHIRCDTNAYAPIIIEEQTDTFVIEKRVVMLLKDVLSEYIYIKSEKQLLDYLEKEHKLHLIQEKNRDKKEHVVLWSGIMFWVMIMTISAIYIKSPFVMTFVASFFYAYLCVCVSPKWHKRLKWIPMIELFSFGILYYGIVYKKIISIYWLEEWMLFFSFNGILNAICYIGISVNRRSTKNTGGRI